MTLLCLSSLAEGPVEVAGEVALDASADFAVGFALGAASFDVGQGLGVAPHPGHGDLVQGSVELTVTEAVEPVPVGAAGGHGNWRGAGQHGEGCLVADPPGVGPRQQDLGGAE